MQQLGNDTIVAQGPFNMVSVFTLSGHCWRDGCELRQVGIAERWLLNHQAAESSFFSGCLTGRVHLGFIDVYAVWKRNPWELQDLDRRCRTV